MATVTAFEAKTRFGELLARVANGEEIVITKYEKPVARLVPEGGRDLARIREGVRRLEELQAEIREQSGSPITDEEIRSARDEGRK